MSAPGKVYLGDSVYAARWERGGIVLTTENGYGASNTIYLEQEVLYELLSYLATLEGEESTATQA